MMREAWFYKKNDHGAVACRLCNHRCHIAPGRRGLCGARENREGSLYSLVYGRLIAEHLDPIEKKPFFHVLPGTLSYSIATVGCNFRCLFCQNHAISQLSSMDAPIPGDEVTPEVLVSRALALGAKSLAYTYTEPTVFFEFAYETARLAFERGLLNLFVTNGYMGEEPLHKIAPYLHAANVDLKSFEDGFYHRQCGAALQPVLDTLRLMKRLGVWVEVTTLLIPDLNDSDGELEALASFVASLGVETPWHVSRFHSRYRLNPWPQTPLERLHRAIQIGRDKGLQYVYSGNVPGDDNQNTDCPSCRRQLIERKGFDVLDMNLSMGRCPSCRYSIAGLF